jgi:transcriptional regulator with XRE-family HTH domain
MEYSPAALGQVIRELREASTPRLSQEELGRKAGYRSGAGVSMSRIENGVTRPGPRRLEGIANTLGVTVRELETRGAQRSAEPGRTDGAQPRADASPGPTATFTPGRDRESTKDRMRRIQGDFDRRNTQAVTGGLAFNAAHDRARDDFFMELVSSARSITGIPAPSAPADVNAHHALDLSPTAEAALRRQVAAHGITATLASGAGAAAADDEADHESAYSAVVAAAMLTPVPSETRHPDPRAGATARATRALLGGGTTHAGATGIAAGTALLAGFVASAASPLIAAGTLAWLARRSRRQNDRLRIELDQAEANLVATQRGFDAVMDILGRATEPLSYIALHASHAHRRWQSQLPASPIHWSDLSDDQQRQYHAFVEVAACQVCVDSINMTELLAAPSEQQARLIQVADDILTLAQRQVEILV